MSSKFYFGLICHAWEFYCVLHNFDDLILEHRGVGMYIFVFFACFRPYVGQPDNHIGWATLMPFASIYPTNPRTHPWNFLEKLLQIDGFKNIVFLCRPFWNLFFKKIFFFASSPWKAVKVYCVARMGRNFDNYHLPFRF